MTKALSVDLRRRVIAAIEQGGSCRQATARFRVSVSSAIRWHAVWRAIGDAIPKRQGGDRRSGPIEAHAALILDALKRTSDITLADLRVELAGHGIAVSVAGLWRFFKRRQITLKKDRACGRAGSSRRPESTRSMGSRGSSISTRTRWCLSTRAAPAPRWLACMDRHRANYHM